MARKSAAAVIDSGDANSPGDFTDDELTALALAADPDQPLDPDAVPMSTYLEENVGLLPEWYMAPVMTRHIRRGPQLVVLAVIGAFLTIEAFGLCSTYGQWPFH
jgi:hypothetical protein